MYWRLHLLWLLLYLLKYCDLLIISKNLSGLFYKSLRDWNVSFKWSKLTTKSAFVSWKIWKGIYLNLLFRGNTRIFDCISLLTPLWSKKKTSYLHAMENIRYNYIRKRHIWVFETIKKILKKLLGNGIVFFIFWMCYGYLNVLLPVSMYKKVGGVTIPNILWKAILASIRSIWPNILDNCRICFADIKKNISFQWYYGHKNEVSFKQRHYLFLYFTNNLFRGAV